MGRPRKTVEVHGESISKTRAPARTPQARENQLVNAAVELAERQIRDGSVSSQVLTHYLKLASSRERLEQEKLRGEINMNKAKEEQLASQKRVEEMYAEALNAMRSYSGQPVLEVEPDYDD